MGRQSVRDVILNRRFGPLEEGRPREHVEKQFGEPAGHVVSEPSHVTYQNVEVVYGEGHVTKFNLYLDRSGEIEFDEYVSLEERLSLDGFPEWCRAHSLEFIQDHYLSYDNAPQYILENEVSVKFLHGDLVFVAVDPKDGENFELLRNDETNRPDYWS
jgi:hypothetical protein